MIPATYWAGYIEEARRLAAIDYVSLALAECEHRGDEWTQARFEAAEAEGQRLAREERILLNLTPHPITLDVGGSRVDVPIAGPIARVASTPGVEVERLALVGGVPVYSAPTWGEIEGLPEPVEGAIFIVSALVGAALRERGIVRPDVVCPGTGPDDGAIRDHGRVRAVTRLVRATGGAS